jgi:hypothetical protein
MESGSAADPASNFSVYSFSVLSNAIPATVVFSPSGRIEQARCAGRWVL